MDIPASTATVVIASYPNYADAQRAVDYLSDRKFPVQALSIVGTDLRIQENVRGRLSWGSVLMAGAAGGAWWGIFVGLLMAIFVNGSTFSLVLWASLYGIVFGMIFSAISYAFTRGQRDFVSTKALVAARYDVLADPSVAADASRILGGDAPAAGPTA